MLDFKKKYIQSRSLLASLLVMDSRKIPMLPLKRALHTCMRDNKPYANYPELPRLCSWFSNDFWLADTKGLAGTGLLLPTGAGVGKWGEAVCTACSMVGLLLKWSIWGLERPGKKPKQTQNPKSYFSSTIRGTGLNQSRLSGLSALPVKTAVSKEEINISAPSDPLIQNEGYLAIPLPPV